MATTVLRLWSYSEQGPVHRRREQHDCGRHQYHSPACGQEIAGLL